MSIFTKAAAAMRSLTGRVRFPGRSFVWFDLDRPDIHDIEREVGDGTTSDVLMTPVRWLQRSIVEAPWIEEDEDGDPIPDSALVELLDAPNPYYAGDALLQATVFSVALSGNGYWIAALNGEGKPVELYYAPHTNVRPAWPDGDSDKFITHYVYKVSGSEQKIRPLNLDPKEAHPGVEEGLAMIHFREGIDPANLRLGLSPLRGLLREIWTDNEAALFTASLLKNGGVPGVVVSPADKEATLTPEEADAAKEKLETQFTRSGRGKPLVALGPTKVEQFGFSPQEMDLAPLRNVPEERVTAALGIPAAVVGFGTGLQQTKVGATMKELRQLAWSGGVIPMQRVISSEVTRSLAPALDSGGAGFDNSDVEALRENQDRRASRLDRLVRGGILTRGEARAELGYETDKSQTDVYLLPISTIEVPANETRPPVGASEEEVRAFWGEYLTKRHSHGGPEDRIIEAAPTRKPPRVLVRVARAIERVRRRAPGIFEERLQEVFGQLGRDALAAAQASLVEEVSDDPADSKQGELGPLDIALVERILEAVDTQAAQVALSEALAAGFAEVATETARAIGGALGTAFEIDDATQREVMRQGGLRDGLIDLDQQTRDAIFDALESGRAEGMTADNLARHIRDHVEAGPWPDAATRARVIARTEGAHAANVSTLEAARTMPETEHVMVFDNRSGYDDPACVEADGSVITIEEAETIGLAHPNCTRSFSPVNSLLMEEMGL